MKYAVARRPRFGSRTSSVAATPVARSAARTAASVGRWSGRPYISSTRQPVVAPIAMPANISVGTRFETMSCRVVNAATAIAPVRRQRSPTNGPEDDERAHDLRERDRVHRVETGTGVGADDRSRRCARPCSLSHRTAPDITMPAEDVARSAGSRAGGSAG